MLKNLPSDVQQGTVLAVVTGSDVILFTITSRAKRLNVRYFTVISPFFRIGELISIVLSQNSIQILIVSISWTDLFEF